MDHHLLPRNPTSEGIRVPCVCNPPYYDGDAGSFLVYPRDKGKSWLVLGLPLSKFISSVKAYEMRYLPPLRELQMFYQQWLFFGFLKEVLGDEFRGRNYTDAEGAYITTRSLMFDVERAWSRCLTSRDEADATYRHISACARVIFTLVFTMHDKIDSSYSPDFTFDWRIVFSIASSAHLIGASLCHAIHQRYGDFKLTTPIRYPTRPLLADFKNNMMSAGWCPSEIHTLSGKFFDLQSLVALSRMDRTGFGRDHRNCTEALCKWYQIDLRHYEPQHTSECPGCDMFTSDQANTAVRKLLNGKDRGLPVLKITGEEDSLGVQVIEATRETRYVAISHVWADGMANPDANSLPRCQVIRLKKWAGGLHNDPRARISEVYVWIDTLCCPYEASNAKKVAITRLQETYTNASYVLVIDKGLLSLESRARSVWEISLWIFSSGWTSRLWTVQEGVLAKDLWFQFKDQALNSQSLAISLSEEADRNFRVSSIRSDLINQFRWLQMFQLPPQSNIHHVLVQIYSSRAIFCTLSLALFRRAVTVMSDEPLCISMLMEIPLVRLLSEEQINEQDNDMCLENRMCRLWRLIDSKLEGIPIGVLIHGHSRLQRPGFRWAPKSFLDAFTEINWENNWLFPQTGRLVQEGLLVKSRGFVISQRKWEDGLNRNPLAALPSFLNSTRITFKDMNSGIFYHIAPHVDRRVPISLRQGPGYDFSEAALLAIVLFMNPAQFLNAASLMYPTQAVVGPNSADEAIIGECRGLGDGRHLITKFARISLAKHDQYFNLFYRVAEEIALSARNLPSVRRMNDFTTDQKDTEEFRAAVAELKAFYIHAATEKFQDETISQAMKKINENCSADTLAICAFDWFWSDYVAESFGEDKEWCID